ncbi:MAG: asparagine synthase-related protein [Acidobacteria bacterium]|nr:asparagine synthase-related protein [Acidobacteriota bacterium]
MLAALPGQEADTEARWTGASVAFGRRGRVLRDDRTGRVPRFDAASGFSITATVRLDGRASLCDALELSRRDRAGLSDSALLLRSYARWGRACPDHLLGDFAFALWDAKRDVLFCARDHVGTRPFYYALTGERFVFASDIAAVLAATGVSGDLDEAAVATRLTYGVRSLGARTCYRAVRRLPPGHALCVERGAVRLHRWWRPEEVPPLPPASDDAVAEQCLAILTEAVRDRLWGAGHVGVHLSGGLDSSGIAVLAARELRQAGRAAPPAFTWYPAPGPGLRGVAEAGVYDRIESVRRQEDLQLLCRPLEPDDVIASLRGDGTRGASSGTLEEMVLRTAAGEGVEVLLSGLGGDEGISFNGRGYYPQLLRSGRVRRLWREVRERHRRPFAALLFEAALPLVSRRTAKVARRLRRGAWPFRKNVAFIHPGFARRVRPLPAGPGLPRAGVRATQLRLLQSGRHASHMEQWAVSGARHGIEYRYPLLDRRVLEFALGLPPEQYRRGRWSRWLMRRALDPILPSEVCWNPSKRESFESARGAVAEAMLKVRGMIEERDELPLRACYLNLPRLLEELDPERWRASGSRRQKPVLNALFFLDF